RRSIFHQCFRVGVRAGSGERGAGSGSGAPPSALFARFIGRRCWALFAQRFIGPRVLGDGPRWLGFVVLRVWALCCARFIGPQRRAFYWAVLSVRFMGPRRW